MHGNDLQVLYESQWDIKQKLENKHNNIKADFTHECDVIIKKHLDQLHEKLLKIKMRLSEGYLSTVGFEKFNQIMELYHMLTDHSQTEISYHKGTKTPSSIAGEKKDGGDVHVNGEVKHTNTDTNTNTNANTNANTSANTNTSANMDGNEVEAEHNLLEDVKYLIQLANSIHPRRTHMRGTMLGDTTANANAAVPPVPT